MLWSSTNKWDRPCPWCKHPCGNQSVPWNYKILKRKTASYKSQTLSLWGDNCLQNRQSQTQAQIFRHLSSRREWNLPWTARIRRAPNDPIRFLRWTKTSLTPFTDLKLWEMEILCLLTKISMDLRDKGLCSTSKSLSTQKMVSLLSLGFRDGDVLTLFSTNTPVEQHLLRSHVHRMRAFSVREINWAI